MLTSLLMIAATVTVADASDRPNLLLITADDLGIQLGCYGDRQAITPNLDAFAESGVRFEVAYVAQASCSPSRSAMLTGFYPHSNGQYGLGNALKGLPPDQRWHIHPEMQSRSLPNLLKGAGYRTGIIGKLHVNPEGSFRFDMNKKEGFGTREVRKQTKFFKEFVSQSEPWFLMANLFDPHVKAIAQNGKSRGSIFPDQVQGLPESPRSGDQMNPFPFQRVDDKQMMKRVAGYYNCVQRVDAGIGMMLDELKASGQADNTVVIILGDHGPPVARGKTTCYEAGLRVPFLVRWPGVSQPHASGKMVSAVDIVPTFLDAAGLPLADDLQGRSLRPVLKGDDAEWRSHLFAEFHFHGDKPFYPRRAVRSDRYKLIHNVRAGQERPHQSVDSCPAPKLAAKRPASSPVHQVFARLQDPPEWELHDLQADPWEWDNLAGSPELAAVESELKQALTDWRDQTNDPFRDPGFVKTVPGPQGE